MIYPIYKLTSKGSDSRKVMRIDARDMLAFAIDDIQDALSEFDDETAFEWCDELADEFEALTNQREQFEAIQDTEDALIPLVLTYWAHGRMQVWSAI